MCSTKEIGKRGLHEKLFNEAIKLRDSGKFESAIEKLTEILEDEPEPRTANSVHGIMGHVFMKMEDYHRSVECFREVLNNSPTSELASLGLFHSLWNLGDTDEAFEEMKRFLRLEESDEYSRLLKDIDSELDSDDSND